MTGDASTEIAEIRNVMRNDPASYIADSGMQSRLLELYDARATGAPVSPRQADGELAAIRKVMKTDLDRYWRDTEMQARYVQLLEQEERGSGVEPGTATGRGALAPVPTPSEWGKQDNDPARYDSHIHLVRAVNDVLTGMGEGDRDEIGPSFAALPATVHSAAFAVLADGRAVGVEPLHDADIRKLAQVPAYRSLAREWGSEAPRKLAVLQERLWRVLDRLSDADCDRALTWFNALPTAAVMAVGRKLAR